MDSARKVCFFPWATGDAGSDLFFSGVPIAEIDITFLTLPSDEAYDPSLDEQLTLRAAESPSEHVRRIKISSPPGKKNWGWNLWQAEVSLGDLKGLIGGETKGQVVVVAKASTSSVIILERWITDSVTGLCRYECVFDGTVDADGHEQTRWPDWNLRGVGFDGWSVKLIEA
jgi:hypothetical protein